MYSLALLLSMVVINESCYLQNCYGKRFFVRKEVAEIPLPLAVNKPSQCPKCVGSAGYCRGPFTCCTSNTCLFSLTDITNPCRTINWTADNECNVQMEVIACVNGKHLGLCTSLGMCCTDVACVRDPSQCSVLKKF